MHRNSSTIDFIINDDNNAKSVFSQLTKFPFEDFIFDSSETKSKREMVNIGIVYCYNTIDVRTKNRMFLVWFVVMIIPLKFDLFFSYLIPMMKMLSFKWFIFNSLLKMKQETSSNMTKTCKRTTN